MLDQTLPEDAALFPGIERYPPVPFPKIEKTSGKLQSDDRLIFLHFEKTAGTTAYHTISSHFSSNAICPSRFDTYSHAILSAINNYRFFMQHAPVRTFNVVDGRRRFMTFFRDPKDRVVSLYRYWSSYSDLFVQTQTPKDDYLRFVRQTPLKELLTPSGLRRFPNFWNLFTQRLAGDLLYAPDGHSWRSHDEIRDAALDGLDNLTTFGFAEYPDISFACVADDLGIENRYDGTRLNVTDRNSARDPTNFVAAPEKRFDDETVEAIEHVNRLDRIVFDSALVKFRERIGAGVRLRCTIRPDLRQISFRGRATVLTPQSAGYVLFGPYISAPLGRYIARFSLTRLGTLGINANLILDVCCDHGRTILARRGTVRQIDDSKFETLELDFVVDHPVTDLEFRLYADGAVPLAVDPQVELVRLS